MVSQCTPHSRRRAVCSTAPDSSGVATLNHGIPAYGYGPSGLSVTSMHRSATARSREAGFARHLTKPFDIEDLENVIQEFLAAPSHPRNAV
jgi:CheY-like chemotaxis protein